MSEIEIVTREFKLGDRMMQPADRFDPQDTYQSKFLTDEAVRNLRRAKSVVQFTPQVYRVASQRFSFDHVGRGFTRAELVALGALEDRAAPPPKAAAAAKPAPKPKAPRPPGKKSAVLEVVEIPPDAEVVNGYLLIARKIAGSSFVNYEVADTAGRLLRASRFKSRDKAVAYLTDLPAAGGSPKGEEGDNSGQQESEHRDDVHIQSDAGDAP